MTAELRPFDGCEHPKVVLAKRPVGAGASGIQYVRWCQKCGATSSAIPYRKLLATEKNAAIDLDPALREKWRRDRFDQSTREWREKNDKTTSERKKFYDEYMRSEKWQEIRQLILQRDNYQCQGCRQRRAVQVHHLTYAHLGDEFLFELISVCMECHHRLHPEHQSDWNDDESNDPTWDDMEDNPPGQDCDLDDWDLEDQTACPKS
jgi:hypothetical protein